MRVLKILLLTLDAIVMFCVGVVIGAMIGLPNERSVTNEIEINAPPDAVWNVINDRERFAEWQPDLSSVDIEDGTRWIEYPKNSPEPLRFMVVEDERPSSMTFKYKMGDSFTGQWRGTVTTAENGSHLETLDSYRVDGQVAKVLTPIFFNMDKFAKRWNEDLKNRVENLYL